MSRLSVDIPDESHRFIKMLAIQEGKTIRDLILESIALKMQQEKLVELDHDNFSKELKRVISERKGMLKRLKDR